jgi:hypothetical protein
MEEEEHQKWVKASTLRKPSPKATESPVTPTEQYVSDTYTITKDVDTRDNTPLWVVKFINKLTRDEYKEINAKMRALNSYYSRYKHGFIFKHNPTDELNKLKEV